MLKMLSHGEDEDILTVEGDRVERPNYAVLWTHGFLSLTAFSGCDYLRQNLGYVFWDKARLV